MTPSLDNDVPDLTTVEEYAGQTAVRLTATQLDYAGYTPAQQKKIVADWMAFFAAGPTPITDLEFASRTPKRLFASLGPQVQLQRLAVKWGDYDDLSVLEAMRDLRVLRLRGASGVRELSSLASLQSVTHLVVESLRYATDLSPIGEMCGVTHLELGGDWHSPRNAHVDSIGFLTRMPQLEELVLHTMIVDDRDYSPLLTLPNLTSVSVKKTRGMQPPFEELKAALPWR